MRDGGETPWPGTIVFVWLHGVAVTLTALSDLDPRSDNKQSDLSGHPQVLPSINIASSSKSSLYLTSTSALVSESATEGG